MKKPPFQNMLRPIWYAKA